MDLVDVVFLFPVSTLAFKRMQWLYVACPLHLLSSFVHKEYLLMLKAENTGMGW